MYYPDPADDFGNFDYASDDSEGRRVKRVCAFYDERYGKNRSITDVDWSPKVTLTSDSRSWFFR